jgi:hypothetical protein
MTKTSRPGSSHQPLAVEHSGHDPPSEYVDEQQRRREANGKA